jgi:Flp pilus assembly protein TadG
MRGRKDLMISVPRYPSAAGGRALKDDESGAVAIIFALTLVPLIGFGGLALDYARVSMSHAMLQSAVDSAGLTVAHLPPDTSVAVVEQKALAWVKGRLAGQDVGPVTLTATRDGKKISFSATTNVETTLFRILRKEPVAVTATSEVSWSIGKVEVALVLDNTGSMQGPKLTNLKKAARSLVDKLKSAASYPDQVKVGVVPFAATVNVGSHHEGKFWMDKGGSPLNREIFFQAPNQNRFALFKKLGQDWGGCVEGRAIPYDVQDTPPDQADPLSLFVPYFAPDEPDTWSNSDKPRNWSGPVNNYLSDGVSFSSNDPTPEYDRWMRRQGNVSKYNKNVGKSTSIGPNAGCTVEELLRLTTDMDEVRKKINAMHAAGDTNGALGLVWGWHVLSPRMPLADGVEYGTPDVTKYAILMTDGENTKGVTQNYNGSRYDGLGYIWQMRLGLNVSPQTPWSNPNGNARTAAIDARLSKLCANMKAVGIEIFTVRVEVNTGSSKLLQDCATKPDMFFNVENSSNLENVFNRIGETISKLRLSK